MSSTSDASWEVSFLQVQTTTADAVTDTLYANGHMQVPVVVVIKAIDPESAATYKLKDSDLEKIKLATENEFDHALPTSRKEPQTDLSLADGDPQRKRYWVTTTKIENKRIGASIEQPDGTVVHTASAGFDSKVTLRSIDPVEYTMNDLNIEQEDTADGNFYSPNYHWYWDQDNYYLTSKIYDFRKVKLYGYDGGTDPYLKYSTGFFSVHEPCNIFYYWLMGSKETLTVGRGLMTTEITINQRANAMCCTRMRFEGANPWKEHHWWEGKFTIYDKFGNSGIFFMGYDEDRNQLQISTKGYEG
ncbi:hypothetical protein BO83DRAFT_411073 [Aspergillus eucalypticola CBS 122712]|uniref:Uncharacterized protein n=1 Tax=Aspergillus eucalypticola (strain CBS 122712 / IBT 29274) TaxID=1448314 RepID=A0A317UXU5_ASPEC|nr:uncharacterized protein BO83DRAFT_411073 [Aspergillus eucalypticola CBS 122712]PWY64820.1 hypothetical protein BO83DRAFT_411073 [Aspergillus eucalypticola CBS 122712]